MPTSYMRFALPQEGDSISKTAGTKVVAVRVIGAETGTISVTALLTEDGSVENITLTQNGNAAQGDWAPRKLGTYQLTAVTTSPDVLAGSVTVSIVS